MILRNVLKSVWNETVYKIWKYEKIIEAMRYLITTNIEPPFLSDWFYAEHHFNAEVGMVVYNLAKGVYTTDGEKWEQIEEDHL